MQLTIQSLCGILELPQRKNRKETQAELFLLDQSEQIFSNMDDDGLLLKCAAEYQGSSGSIGAMPWSQGGWGSGGQGGLGVGTAESATFDRIDKIGRVGARAA